MDQCATTPCQCNVAQAIHASITTSQRQVNDVPPKVQVSLRIEVDSKLSARHEIPFGIATSPSCHRNTTDWYRHSQKSQFVVHSKGGQGNGQVSRNRSTTVPAHKLKGRRPSRQQDDKRNFIGTIRHDKVNDIEILANAECEPLTSKGEALATAIEELPPKYRHTPSLVSDVDAIQEAVHVIRTLRCELKELKAQVELARQPSA